MPFEPEKWDSSKYDSYMDWCGGVSYSGSDDIPNKFVDNFDMQNLKNEDNLYKKLKGYICMCRRYLEYQGYPKPDFITEEFVQENMNDFRELLKDNIDEILTNLSMTKWLYSIIICFIDLGTEEEKTKSRPPNVIYQIILTWDGESNDDLDIYVQSASGHTVAFNNREGGQGSLISLDHDALGKYRNNSLGNGQDGTVVNYNEEIVSFRGITSGENIVTVHVYSKRDEQPIKASIKLIKIKSKSHPETASGKARWKSMKNDIFLKCHTVTYFT